MWADIGCVELGGCLSVVECEALCREGYFAVLTNTE